MLSVLSLSENLTTNRFNELLDFCFDTATHFSLTEHIVNVRNEKYDALLNDLFSCQVRKITTSDWFCYHVLPDIPFHIHVYKTDSSAKSIIMNNFDNLFFRKRNTVEEIAALERFQENLIGKFKKELRQDLSQFIASNKKDKTFGNPKELPEDLCFFLEGRLLLGTLSHADICYAFCDTEGMKNSFLSFGEWEEIDYGENERIFLNI